jgi:hypothetical protein
MAGNDGNEPRVINLRIVKTFLFDCRDSSVRGVRAQMKTRLCCSHHRVAGLFASLRRVYRQSVEKHRFLLKNGIT